MPTTQTYIPMTLIGAILFPICNYSNAAIFYNNVLTHIKTGICCNNQVLIIATNKLYCYIFKMTD